MMTNPSKETVTKNARIRIISIESKNHVLDEITKEKRQ